MAEIVTDKGKAPNREGQKEITAALNLIAQKIDAKTQIDTGDMNSVVLACIDGTPEGFKRALKLYFQLHKITNTIGDDGTTTYPTAAQVTAGVTGFYGLLQNNFKWDGGVKFYHPDVSSQSTGARFGDNAGLTCVPSAKDTHNQDDYEGLPLFATIDCNWVMDATNKCPQITAIDGVVGKFERYNTGVFVGVLQMTGYHYWTNPGDEGAQYYTEGYRIGYNAAKPNCAPLPEAVATDGTVRPWVIHGKYNAGLVDGKFTNCSGTPLSGNQSENTIIDFSNAIGTSYSGTCSCDLGFLQIMARIKFASLTLDGILEFDKTYNVSNVAKVAETGVKRVLIDVAQKNNYIIGSKVAIGISSDLRQAFGRTAEYTVVAADEVTVNGTTYAAIYVETDTPFDVVAGNTDNTKNTQILSAKWMTGTTDDVPGNTGAIDPTNSKYPAKLQGIEFGLGAYEVLSDTIINLTKEKVDNVDTYYEETYTCKDATKQAKSLTNDYTSCGIKILQDGEGYIKEQKWGKDGVLYPTKIGGSSSTYARDCHYHNNQDQKQTGAREWLAFGVLGHGAAAGLSSLLGGAVLGLAWWDHAARLSPNGFRG